MWGAVLAHRVEKLGWTWVMGILAAIFNPVLPIHLEREVWAFIDVAVAVVFVASTRRMAPVQKVPALQVAKPEE